MQLFECTSSVVHEQSVKMDIASLEIWRLVVVLVSVVGFDVVVVLEVVVGFV